MRPHVALLGILQLVWGAIALLLGGSTLMLAVGAVAIGLTSRTEGFSAAATAAVFGVFAVALLLGGLANAWAGAALRRQEPSGRMVTLGLAAPTVELFIACALVVGGAWIATRRKVDQAEAGSLA